LATTKEKPMPIVPNHAATAVDTAKSVFEVAVSIQPGRVSERKTLSRSGILEAYRNRELGVFLPAGASKVVPLVHEYIGDAESDCPDALRPTLDTMCREIRELEASIRATEAQPERLAKDLPIVAQLRSIPGIGLLTATALVGFVGDVRRFKNARRFASYLGLTPKEFSTGKKRRLGRISKQGNTYLRHLLIHGARSLLRAATTKKQTDPHKAATAVANKLARIVWAVWSRNDTYHSLPAAA
jgi:transposase